MNFKKLLAFTFASLAMGNVASIAQITPIDQCNVKDMTMCGSDLYVATNEGYLIFDTKVGETKEMKTVGNLTSIIAKDQTDLWYIANLGMSSTINHVKGTETTTYSVANGAIKGGQYADVRARGLAYGPNNTVWFGAYGFFHKFDGKEWTNYTCPASNFGRIYYKCFAFDSNGTVWVAGSDQQKNATFGEFDPVKGEQTPVACDFASDGVNSMFVDANDNVWIGTDYKGFYKYDGSTFVNYNKDSEANIDINIKTSATTGLCRLPTAISTTPSTNHWYVSVVITWLLPALLPTKTIPAMPSPASSPTANTSSSERLKPAFTATTQRLEKSPSWPTVRLLSAQSATSTSTKPRLQTPSTTSAVARPRTC